MKSSWLIPFALTLGRVIAGGSAAPTATCPACPAQTWQDCVASTVYKTTTEYDYKTSYSTVTDYKTMTYYNTVTDYKTTTYYNTVTDFKTSVSVSVSYVTSYVTVQGPTTVVTSYVSQAPSIVTRTTTVTVPSPTTIVNNVPSPTTIVNNVPSPTTVVNVVPSLSTVTNVVPSVAVSTVQNVATVTATVTVTSVRSVANVQTVTQSALVGLVTCESRIVNPTYTPPAPLPSTYLWGCPPGKLCYPPRIGCNFEQGDPAPGYVCKPEDCRPVAALPPRDVYLRANQYQNNGTCAFITPIDDYFNLNPLNFGLNYGIFNIYGQATCSASTTCPAAKTVTVKNDVTIPQTVAIPTTLTVIKTTQVPTPVTIIPEKSSSTWASWQGSGEPPKVTKRAVLEKRQQQPLIAYQPCYVSCQYANAAWQSIGNNPNDLCNADSDYINAYNVALQCNAEYTDGASASSIVSELNEPRGICNQAPVKKRWARDVPW